MDQDLYYDFQDFSIQASLGRGEVKIIAENTAQYRFYEGKFSDEFAREKEFESAVDIFDLLKDNIDAKRARVAQDSITLDFRYTLKGQERVRKVVLPMKQMMLDEVGALRNATGKTRRDIEMLRRETEESMVGLETVVREQHEAINKQSRDIEGQTLQLKAQQTEIQKMREELENSKKRLGEQTSKLNAETPKIDVLLNLKEQVNKAVSHLQPEAPVHKFVPDTKLEVAKKYFTITEDFVVTKQTDDEFTQVVGLHPLPKNGVYIANLRPIKMGEKKIVLFGVVTLAGRTAKSCASKEEININFADKGYTNVEGVSNNVKCFDVNDGDKVTMVVDRQVRKISWLANGNHLYTVNMSVQFALKELYPKIELKFRSDKVQIL